MQKEITDYKMKVAIYCRVSTEEQSSDNQIKDCKSINSYGEYSLFSDKQSAWKDNKERENFERLKKEIINKKVEHLIVWDWDRIYRNRKNLKNFFQLCAISNCKIHSFRQQWYERLNDMPSPFDEITKDFFLNMMGWLAEDESTKKSERVKLAVRKKEGQETKSYKGNKWGRKNISTQKKNKLIELYNLNPNMSLREISKELQIPKSTVHKYLNLLSLKKLKNDKSIN